MAKVIGTTIPPGMEELFQKALKTGAMYSVSNLGKSPSQASRQRLQVVDLNSMLAEVATMWDSIFGPEQFLWAQQYLTVGFDGYALFTQDTIYRMRNGLEGTANPVFQHQFFIGKIHIESPSNSVRIEQSYNGAYEAGSTIAVSMRNDLSNDGGTKKIRVGVLTTLDDGGNVYEDDQYLLGATYPAWYGLGLYIQPRAGTILSYKFYIEISNATGDLWLDNIRFLSLGTIISPDRNCDNFPFGWTKISGGAGVSFESLYCPDSINT